MAEIEVVVVDVDLAHLSESMSLELDKLAGKPNKKERDNFAIFPVPSKFRQGKENLFDPSFFSIGPLHHGKESLKAKEVEKWQLLQIFLSRGDDISLDLCLSEIKKLEEKTRRCYSESVPLDSNSFVQMMLLDGCYVLERLIFGYEHKLDSFFPDFIPSDLLLLENQIPFFIVDKLCEIGIKAEDRMNFRNYLVNVFNQAGPSVLDDSIIPKPPDEIHHFAHLCYQCSIPNDQNEPAASNRKPFRPSILTIIKYSLLEFFLWVLTRIFPKSNSLSFSPKYTRKSFMMIPCATELRNAGIKLIPKSKPYCMLDISFDHRVLQIPRIIITNGSKTILANLIAFEQYKLEDPGMRAILSSYALFLDSLVNTLEDVKILQKCGIVNNYLDSEEELTNFFNQICEGMDANENHFFCDLFEGVNEYCESSWGKRRARWNRHKTQFIRTYFSSPWTAISLVAAVFIVLLTCVQSFYAVYAYYVPPR